MVVSVGTSDSEKKEHAPCSSTPANGTQQGPVVWTAPQSTQEAKLNPPFFVPPHASRPTHSGKLLTLHPNESLPGSSRASTVQCDEILSNAEFAHNDRAKIGSAKDAQPHVAQGRIVHHVRFGENDLSPRKPVDTDQNADLYSFIKFMAKEQIQGAKPAQWKRYDGVIVYDRRDYDQAAFYKRVMEDMMSQSDVKEPVRIELYDSEQFVQSSVRVVDDVISKSSVIFVLLSVHSNTRQINFFCEEAVARLHVDPINQSPFGAVSAFDTPLKCIIKPLQTAPSSLRQYPIPPGLMSMTSIDIFDNTSSFARDKIISTLREAINTRVRQEEKENTKREFSYMHGLTTGSQAPPQYSSRPIYHLAFNGDIRPSSGHHHQTFDGDRQTKGGVASGSTAFIRPSSSNHYPALNGDRHPNGGMYNVANGTFAIIKPPSEHHKQQQYLIPQKYHSPETPYVNMRVSPLSPEPEPNRMDLLPPFFATHAAPPPVTQQQHGVHTTQQRHQPVVPQKLPSSSQQHVLVTRSPDDWHGTSPVTTITMSRTYPRKNGDSLSSKNNHVQHDEVLDQRPNGNGHVTETCFSTDGLRSTSSSASVLGRQHSSLINRRQYISPFHELMGMGISTDVFPSQDLNSDDLEIDQGVY